MYSAHPAIILLSLHSWLSCSQEHSVGAKCRSVGKIKFDSSQYPKYRNRLDVCSKYQHNTCCNKTHTGSLRTKIMEPVVAGFSNACRRITEEFVCASCHPLVGTRQMRKMCPNLCQEWYSACEAEFYSYEANGKALVPCYGNALICSPLFKIVNSGTDFCAWMGHEVGTTDDIEDQSCFDGSVPTEVGQKEDSNKEKQRSAGSEFQDESSDFFIVIFMLPIVVVFVGYRVLKRFLLSECTSDTSTISLERARILQQEMYNRTCCMDEDSDTDSDPGDQHQE
uniref:Uncharacterized protein AlNc14C211G8920 n=1 Tax=Albugo laibachii Nc14 TaxID=890382 RepID=F0WRB3_9STRA|nr:conserved hypothetical protein [Albugo laibachii Nc14]|eukprot:CCA23875.1 conserved hypothetical protein [Albugo laibachii Nc14]